MRRIIAAGCALALGVVLTGCFGGETPVADTTEYPEVGAPVESPVVPVETPAPEPVEPEPQVTESPGPAGEPPGPAAGAHYGALEQTFVDLLDAMAADGEESMQPFLADPDAGDLWGLSDWEWTAGPCAEGGPGESGCVGMFIKDGVEVENVFGFDAIDGEWVLVESWVAEQ